MIRATNTKAILCDWNRIHVYFDIAAVLFEVVRTNGYI